MGFLQDKKKKKFLQNIKQVNHSGSDLLEYLKKTYTFTTEEEKQINQLQTHLLNMNVIFTELEKVK